MPSALTQTACIPSNGKDVLRVDLVLPAPPTVNRAFINRRGGGRALSQAAEDWLSYAGYKIREQGSPKIDGPIIAVLNIDRDGSLKHSDLDNRLKLLFDVLQKNGVIENDKDIVGIAAAWGIPHSKQVRLALLSMQAVSLDFRPLPEKGACGGWFITAPQTEMEPKIYGL